MRLLVVVLCKRLVEAVEDRSFSRERKRAPQQRRRVGSSECERASRRGATTKSERRLEPADTAAGGDITFAIVRDGRVAGGCGLHRRGGPSTLEIGCWTHPAFLRLGVARTAARLLTGLAFTVPGIERAGIHHGKASQASAGVPRSSGYRPIGEQPGTPSAPAGHGIDCTWRITWDEWLNAR